MEEKVSRIFHIIFLHAALTSCVLQNLRECQWHCLIRTPIILAWWTLVRAKSSINLLRFTPGQKGFATDPCWSALAYPAWCPYIQRSNARRQGTPSRSHPDLIWLRVPFLSSSDLQFVAIPMWPGTQASLDATANEAMHCLTSYEHSVSAVKECVCF